MEDRTQEARAAGSGVERAQPVIDLSMAGVAPVAEAMDRSDRQEIDAARDFRGY